MRKLWARFILFLIRPAIKLDLEQYGRPIIPHIPRRNDELISSAIESAYLEYNGLNSSSVCAKYGLTTQQFYRHIKARRAAALSKIPGGSRESAASGQRAE